MRSLIAKLLSTSLALYATGYLIQGFHIEESWQVYIVGSFIFLILNFFVSPVLKLLLLPINLLTLGLFRWVVNVAIMYLFDLVYDGLTISAYEFQGVSNSFITLAPTQVSYLWVIILSSFAFSLIYSLISSLFNNE